MRFAGKIVLVAGGTGALGRAVVFAFLAEGATVISTYRAETELSALKAAAQTNAAKLCFAQCADLADAFAVEQMVATILAKHSRIDVLVNTVGGYTGGVSLWDLAPAAFEQMLAMNLKVGYALARAVAPAMLKQKNGSIVNVASRAALDHAAGAASYAASKAAALAMIDSLAADLKGTGVRANSILPGIIDTEPNRKAMPGADFNRWPKTEDIAHVILFLCSDDAKLINGAAIPVYGDS